MSVRNLIFAAAGGAGVPIFAAKILPWQTAAWGGVSGYWPGRAALAYSSVSGTAYIAAGNQAYPNSALNFLPNDGFLALLQSTNGVDFGSNAFTYPGPSGSNGGLGSTVEMDTTSTMILTPKITTSAGMNSTIDGISWYRLATSGAVKVLSLSGLINNPNDASRTQWGRNFSMSADGQWVVVACPSPGNIQNGPYIYRANNTAVTLISGYNQQQIINFSANGGSVGEGMISISTDGQIVAMSTYESMVRVLYRNTSNNSWSNNTINAPAGTISWWGSNCALSGNGFYLAVSEGTFSGATGAARRVWIYSRSGTSWTLIKTLTKTPPSTVSSSWGAGLAFNNNGTVLSISDNSTNTIDIYKGSTPSTLGYDKTIAVGLSFGGYQTIPGAYTYRMNSAGNILIGSGYGQITVWQI